MQYVRRGPIKSSKVHLTCGVLQGLGLGLLLVSLYTADFVPLIAGACFSAHLCAEDTQVRVSCRPAEINTF